MIKNMIKMGSSMELQSDSFMESLLSSKYILLGLEGYLICRRYSSLCEDLCLVKRAFLLLNGHETRGEYDSK